MQPEELTAQLQQELWTSWASLLRSYAAVHGLGKSQHAVLEVSESAILIRFGQQSALFTHREYIAPDGTAVPFALTVNGRARIGETEDEMDLHAERLASAIINA